MPFSYANPDQTNEKRIVSTGWLRPPVITLRFFPVFPEVVPIVLRPDAAGKFRKTKPKQRIEGVFL